MDAIIRFLQRFIYDLSHATIFAAIEYDDRLKMTKTPTQRILIWIVISIIVTGIAIGLLYLIWHLLDAISVPDIYSSTISVPTIPIAL
ncbi:hypothetical protein A2861_02295 [Candidatus Roizmanbacteria bacterium RIFCSPHIGHO2_01_FULL_38_15]|nr:MAG: hypothetical protein A2861_02295 [Candidatus Roizmanbacteria bacterium RIFCSPHIGHO2_01_FULL_38_15]